MKGSIIIFRADASAHIGLGHVSRCLAIVEAIRENYTIWFVTRTVDDAILKLIKSKVDRLIHISALVATDYETEIHPFVTGNEIIVLDGYNFNEYYQLDVKKNGHQLLVIDDLQDGYYYADIILNYCGAVDVSRYKKEFYGRVFAGAKYCVLKRPYLNANIRTNDGFKNILLNMGGADSQNLTLKYLEKIRLLAPTYTIFAVTGAAYRHSDSLNAILSRDHSSIKLMENLSAEELHKIMLQCSVAILPASTIALEFIATTGLLFVVQTADNQRCMFEYLTREGVALPFSDFTDTITNANLAKIYQSMVGKQKDVFDGKAADRIQKVFNKLSKAQHLVLRPAQVDDAHQIYLWASDPEARVHAFDKRVITWEGHCEWFKGKIASPHCNYYLAEYDGVAIGQIRFDRNENGEHVISYQVDKKVRGSGFGTILLLNGVKKLREDNASATVIIGYVMIVNSSSCFAFENAGFVKLTQNLYPNSYKYQLSLMNV